MALQKQSVPINFAQGLDTKTDPKQVQPGKFLTLNNSVFGEGGLLQKRNGYERLTTIANAKNITTFNGNLITIGDTISAYSAGSNTVVEKGNYQALDLVALSLVRSTTSQTEVDCAIAPNGIVLTAYTDNIPFHGTTTPSYKYEVSDSTTGQNLVPPTVIVSGAGAVTSQPRTFALGNYLVVVYAVGSSLRYFAVSSADPTTVSPEATLSTQYGANTKTLAFDGLVVNNALYMAWNGSDGGGAIRMAYIDTALAVRSLTVFAGQTATIMSLSADTSGSTAVIYVNYYDANSTNGFAFAVSPILTTVFGPTPTIIVEDIDQLTSYANNGVCTFLAEVDNNYGYDSSIPTHYIEANTITQAGLVGVATIMSRSVGLASKAFAMNGIIYALTAYESSFQSTYFLMSTTGNVISKIAYSNGGGYYHQSLPSVTVVGTSARIPYLFKDLITSISKNNGLIFNTNGVFSQTGINLATFNYAPDEIVTSEIGKNINITGGMLWAYDGTVLTEQGFHLYPDSVEAVSMNPTTTGDVTNGSKIILNVGFTANLSVRMLISGTGIPVGTIITAINGTTITMSLNATATNTSVALTFTGQPLAGQQYFYKVIYEWTDNEGNIIRSAPSIPVGLTPAFDTVLVYIPTLRVTYKTDVRIQVFRWSQAQQIYYQVTQINQPIENDKTVDYVIFPDIYTDAQILGNAILYTEGGVLENIPPPAVSSMTLYQSRLFVIDSEDPNQIFFSKQVIPNVPVEMSDLLSIYAAPTTGVQGSTGPNKALSPLDDKLIIFKKDAIYYINGLGPDNTGANSQFSEPTIVTSTVGCSNQNSIALIPMGLVFESDKGIWLLGRDLGTQYIGAPVEKYTQEGRVLCVISVPGTNQVRFSLDTGVTLMYDYYYGQWGTFSRVPAISTTVYGGVQTYLDGLGRVFEETPGQFLDDSSPVLMNFTTGWMNLAGLQGFERAYYLYILATYLSPHKLNVSIAYDYNDNPSQSSIIVPDNYTPNWGGEQLWGSGQVWGGNGNIEQWRVFLQQQKCQAFQVSISESYDSTVGPVAGAGFTMSGINMIIGTKKGYPTLRPSRSVG